MPGGQDDDDEKTNPGFTVSDRRVAGAADPPGSPRPPAAEPASEPIDLRAQGLPAVDFHTFILSLGSSALFHLGELDGPDGQESAPDLPLAKHTIDVIAMLEAKTRGNLTPPEASLLENLLTDLRLRYVEKSKAASTVA